MKGDPEKSVKERLLRSLLEAGACAVGVAEAAPVAEVHWLAFERWLEEGMHGGMEYMTRHRELRRDPRLLLEGAKSVVSVAFNYRQPNPVGSIATYALGLDYHNVLRERIQRVLEVVKAEAGGEFRICIDSAPVLERYWAEKSGVGVRSPLSGNIIVPGVGSMVFLAEILTTHRLEPDSPLKPALSALENRGDVCPTGALQDNGTVDSHRCINYLTIEHRGEWTEEQRNLMALPGAARQLFGCDICQRAEACNLTQGPAPVVPELCLHPLLSEFVKYVKCVAEKEGGVAVRPPFPLKKSPLSRAGINGLVRNLRKG